MAIEHDTDEEAGPIYGVRLLLSLPLDDGMKQAMPSRRNLEKVKLVNERTVAGFEVLTAHYQARCELLAKILDLPAREIETMSVADLGALKFNFIRVAI